MGQCLMGVETEFAVGGPNGHGSRYLDVELLLARAVENLVSLPGFGMVGIFLENGSRLYIDSGNHPEFCTPECTNPTDVVRYLLAGEKIMTALSRRAVLDGSLKIYKHNQDYLTRQTWGCHESYLHRSPPARVRFETLSHLVTRIIYTGAGGFDAFRLSPEFLISPRTAFLRNVTTEHSTGTRGILHHKDEPLAEQGYHRFHLLCGESVSSHLSCWLKMATTMLVVAVADACLRPTAGVELADPLLSMLLLAEDSTMRTRLQLRNGEQLTAIEIQRRYLTQVRRYQKEVWMPEWAESACDLWEATLNELDHGPEAVSTKLDWSIKRDVFEGHSRKRGFDAARLERWKLGLREAQAALVLAGETGVRNASMLLDDSSSPGKDVERALRNLWGSHYDRDELKAVLSLSNELREIDVRFAELGDDGLFGQLDRAGVLNHHVEGVTDIDAAMTEPPRSGRARLRGLAIRECFAERHRYACDWEGISDRQELRLFDLSEPFVSEASWSYSHQPPFQKQSSFAEFARFR